MSNTKIAVGLLVSIALFPIAILCLLVGGVGDFANFIFKMLNLHFEHWVQDLRAEQDRRDAVKRGETR